MNDPAASPPPDAPAKIDEALFAALAQAAPEADPRALAPDADLREALDIDSFGFLQVVVALAERLGVEIPERDYPQVRTLGGCRRYLAARLAGPPAMS